MPISTVLALMLLTGFHSPYCDTHPPARASGIRAVDFCNFTYPDAKPPSVDSKDDVLPRTFPSSFKLENGIRAPQDELGGGLITLEDVQYADVTHDGREDAMVTMTWHSGGSMQRDMVYIWSLKRSAPVLLWSFVAGDRGFGGLHRVYASNGDLVVDLNDPGAAMGNCCSRRFIRTSYRWNGAKFVPHGKPESLPNPDFAGKED